eukprot:Sdes_comp18351_c0_seq1m8113
MSLYFKHCCHKTRTILLPKYQLSHLCRAMSTTTKPDKKLFTPGPLGVSLSTKQAMLRDLGSRDAEFISLVNRIRTGVVDLAKVSPQQYTMIPIQGSGTFAVEAVITSSVPRGGQLLIFSNGAYAQRIQKIAEYLEISHVLVEFAETEKTNLAIVEQKLKELSASLTNVAIVHCETSSGVINPVESVGKLVRQITPNASFFVDAMSSFGAVPVDLQRGNVDFMVSSANKCIEGVPGFSFVVAKSSALNKCKGLSRSLSLDLFEQAKGLNQNGQFRFTPATHAMLAFDQALRELSQEGGVEGRSARYRENRRICREEMKRMGFKELLDDSHQGYIITSYLFPKHPNFNFEKFYSLLNDRDLVIYPGKVTKIDSFRIGNIGHIFPKDMQRLMAAIQQVCTQMGLPIPLADS